MEKKREKKETGFITGKGETVFEYKREREGHERESVLDPFDPQTQPRTATLTWRFLPIPATSPAVLGIDLKLGSRPSYPSCPRYRKPTRTPVIWAWKLAAKTHFRRRRFRRSLGTLPAGFYSSRHQHHFPTNLVTWNSRIAGDQPLGKLAVLEARFAAVAARGRPPGAPLDSLRSELLDLAFRCRRMNSDDRWLAMIF